MEGRRGTGKDDRGLNYPLHLMYDIEGMRGKGRRERGREGKGVLRPPPEKNPGYGPVV